MKNFRHSLGKVRLDFSSVWIESCDSYLRHKWLCIFRSWLFFSLASVFHSICIFCTDPVILRVPIFYSKLDTLLLCHCCWRRLFSRRNTCAWSPSGKTMLWKSSGKIFAVSLFIFSAYQDFFPKNRKTFWKTKNWTQKSQQTSLGINRLHAAASFYCQLCFFFNFVWIKILDFIFSDK